MNLTEVVKNLPSGGWKKNGYGALLELASLMKGMGLQDEEIATRIKNIWIAISQEFE